MGASSDRVKLTAEEGQMLFKMCLSFGLPKKLGEKLTFEPVEQAQAADENRALWRELKSRSPMWVKKRQSCFGPAENWKSSPTKEDPSAMSIINNDLLVPINVDEQIRWGIYWALLLYLHPESPARAAAAYQEDVYWPIAVKARLVTKLKNALGTYGVATKKLDLDDEPKDERAMELVPSEEGIEEEKLDPA